ncbi:hypothetical protein BDZ85DRAFT_4946 [Elsinoe ampelina]|uniref:Uncharacterized protein n=1 Tax=Elsinoe ampelina TaxID=302913 RepID=A0A6A6GQC1_9PEZI|nr:hypothetical protein BDZ85DRAFT_4946 [Elsinoe ampelina]
MQQASQLLRRLLLPSDHVSAAESSRLWDTACVSVGEAPHATAGLEWTLTSMRGYRRGDEASGRHSFPRIPVVRVEGDGQGRVIRWSRDTACPSSYHFAVQSPQALQQQFLLPRLNTLTTFALHRSTILKQQSCPSTNSSLSAPHHSEIRLFRA